MKRLLVAAALSLAAILAFAPIAGAATVTTTMPTASAPADVLATDPAVVVTQQSDGDTVVTIPAGDIITKVLGWARDIIITGAIVAIGIAGRMLPKTLVNMILTNLTEKNIGKAIDFGINAVSGATKGMTFDVNVGSQVIANALQFLLDNLPGWFIKWMGGPDRIRDKIIARIPLDSMATAVAVSNATARRPVR